MFKYKTSQKVYEIDGLKIGGNSFEIPPVLIASIFYHGHKVFINEQKGLFNRDTALQLIESIKDVSTKTGLPFLLDVVINSPDASENLITFSIDAIKGPLIIDSPGPEVTKAAMKVIKELGVSNRVIFNSITEKTKDEEYQALQDAGVKATIALLYTNRFLEHGARLKALDNILSKAPSYGIEKFLVDTFILDLPSLSVAIKTIIEVKSRYGLPAGTAAHNAVSVQAKGFKQRFGVDGYRSMEIASNAAVITAGANFILCGPIESCIYVYPAIYTIYTSFKYSLSRSKEELLINI